MKYALITIVKAHFMHSSSTIISKQDYANFNYGNQLYQTKVSKRHDDESIWNQQFKLYIDKKDVQALVFNVYSKDDKKMIGKTKPYVM